MHPRKDRALGPFSLSPFTVQGIDCDYFQSNQSTPDLARSFLNARMTVFGAFPNIFRCKESIATIPEAIRARPFFPKYLRRLVPPCLVSSLYFQVQEIDCDCPRNDTSTPEIARTPPKNRITVFWQKVKIGADRYNQLEEAWSHSLPWATQPPHVAAKLPPINEYLRDSAGYTILVNHTQELLVNYSCVFLLNFSVFLYSVLGIMAPKLYMARLSPPVRAVLMCAKSLDLKLDLIEVDLLKKEHLKPEFLKINPVHTIPVLDDNGFLLVDSHAIMIYLIEAYGNDRSLYPDDVKKRARINQMLHLDCGIIFARHLRICLPLIFTGVKVIPEENLNALIEAYGFLETLLQNSTYIAGDSVSIADLSLIATITNADAIVPLDGDKYPRISAWKKLLEALPYYDINKTAAAEFKGLIKELLSK
ncbi:hypothetical protein NQ317_011902 [Molorchus minor]|uniref:Uncharacterized protein n=1 Tax=Molorchus minor TaxID=1323400 RepID=A0ABQ9J3I8_9CUCU|nr:hypothetical protein NQ317_011902 [Molorchus minor]